MVTISSYIWMVITCRRVAIYRNMLRNILVFIASQVISVLLLLRQSAWFQHIAGKNTWMLLLYRRLRELKNIWTLLLLNIWMLLLLNIWTLFQSFVGKNIWALLFLRLGVWFQNVVGKNIWMLLFLRLIDLFISIFGKNI